VIPLSLYLAFVAASAAFILVPGPSVATIIGSAVAHGGRHGLATVAGTSTGIAVQLAIVVFALSSLGDLLTPAIEPLRWAGAAYLCYLAVRTWTSAEAPIGAASAPTGLSAMYLRGLFISFTNPKALLFYAAFLPQFVVPGTETWPQLAFLAATFLVIAVVLDSAWALLAARSVGALNLESRRVKRVTALLFAGAALALVFVSVT
jgi:threonine/homoserine/homoserine lactone efflux protein